MHIGPIALILAAIVLVWLYVRPQTASTVFVMPTNSYSYAQRADILGSSLVMPPHRYTGMPGAPPHEDRQSVRGWQCAWETWPKC